TWSTWTRRTASRSTASRSARRASPRATRSRSAQHVSVSTSTEVPMAGPIEVLLKFAFIAVLYLFLLWVARSALKDLRRPAPHADAYLDADFNSAGDGFGGHSSSARLIAKQGGGL